MATTWSFTKQANVGNGTYTVELVNIGEPFEDTFDNKTRMVSRFYYKVVGPKMLDMVDENGEEIRVENPYIGQEVSNKVNTGSFGTRSTLYAVVQALTGQDPKSLGEVGPDDLIGKRCKAEIVVNPTGEYSNIKSLTALPTVTGKQTPFGVATKTVAPKIEKPAQEEEGESILF